MINAVLYTDGSASIRDDGTFLCGYSYAIIHDGSLVYGAAYPGVGTINQAEMCAVYQGVYDSIYHGINITEVYTDSTYVVNGIRSNMMKLDTGNWVNSNGTEVSNIDMWKGLCAFWKGINNPPDVIHVKGHTGLPFNDLCDQLAKEAAITQKPVAVWGDYNLCVEYGLSLPTVPGVLEVPALVSTAVEVVTNNPLFSPLVDKLSEYTDDRGRACIVKYPPNTEVLVTKGVACWQVCGDQGLKSDNTLHAVSAGTRTLELYKYRAELGVPIHVLARSANIIWHGKDAVDILKEVSERAQGKDIVIVSYNRVGAKDRGLQGLYLTGLSNHGNADMLGIIRTERHPHGSHMVIPGGYLNTLIQCLECPDSAVGFVESDGKYTLVVTGADRGIMIGSAVLPHSISCQGLQVSVKESGIKVTFTDPAWAKDYLKERLHSVKIGMDLSSVLVTPSDTSDFPAVYQPVLEVTTGISPDIPAPIIAECPDANEDTVDDITDLRSEYARLTTMIQELEAKRSDLFNRMIDAKFRYPEMTPQRVEEIEARVRSEMKDKLTSLFI